MSEVHEKVDCSEVLKLIPAEYWEKTTQIRKAVEAYTSENKLKHLQEVTIYFAYGAMHGEEEAIDRIRFLEAQVSDLTDLNQRLIQTLKEATSNQSTQDVKQEE